MTGALHADAAGDPCFLACSFCPARRPSIYQTAWHRLLGLFAGADTIAAALVVGAFLLGLGIGSLAAGLLADRLSRRAALLAFALCEVGIAAFAVASPWLYYDVIYRELLPLSSSRGVIFAVVFAGLLWPTFLMGCSLPFLSKAVVSEIAGSAKLIGWLYGLNTLGAGVGAFVGGWYPDRHVRLRQGGLCRRRAESRGRGRRPAAGARPDLADGTRNAGRARRLAIGRRRGVALVAAGLHQRLPDRGAADRLVPPDRRAAAVQRLQLLAGPVGVPAGRCRRPAGRRAHHRPHRRSAALLLPDAGHGDGAGAGRRLVRLLGDRRGPPARDLRRPRHHERPAAAIPP